VAKIYYDAYEYLPEPTEYGLFHCEDCNHIRPISDDDILPACCDIYEERIRNYVILGLRGVHTLLDFFFEPSNENWTTRNTTLRVKGKKVQVGKIVRSQYITSSKNKNIY